MGRFSPSTPGTGDIWLDFADDVERAMQNRRAVKRQQQIDQERSDEVSYARQQDALDRQVAFEERVRRNDRQRDQDQLQDLELARQGLRRGRAPEDQPFESGRFDFPELVYPDDVMDEAGGIGMQRQESPAPPVFSNARFRAPGAGQSAGTLADDLEGYTSGRAATAEPEVLALPGQFVPELGGFTPKAILAPPPAPPKPIYTPMRQQRTHRQVTPDFYEVVEETPEYREQQAERSRLERMMGAARAAGASEEEAALLEFDDGLLDDMLDPTPKRGSKEWYDMLEQEERARRSGRGTAAEDESIRPTLSQAREIVRAKYAIYEPNPETGEMEWVGYSASEDRMYNEARELARTGEMPEVDLGAGGQRGFGGGRRPEAPLSAGFEGLAGDESGRSAVDDPFLQDIEEELRSKSPAEILRDMEKERVPAHLIDQAREYLGMTERR